jgi:beta-hydroxylase
LFTAASIALAVVLLSLVAPTLYLHYRGSVRRTLRRQIGDYSTLLAPYNAWVCARSALPPVPMFDVATFPELAVLREHWQEIRDEVVALMDEGRVRRAENQDDLVFYSFCKRGWQRFYLTWYGRVPRSAQVLCPKTVALLRSIPSVHGAMFAVIPPGSKLGKHRDPFGGCLRYHLGLVTPNSPACRMFVDDREHVWRDGEDVLFDPMFIHKAANETDIPRVVLFCDVERPMKGVLSTAINRAMITKVVGRLTTTGNAEGDHVSAANRLFARLAPLRRAIRATKSASPRLYYSLKTAVFAAPVAALVWLVLALQ